VPDRPNGIAAEDPAFPVDDEALAALETLWSAGHAAYLVGGGVRDALLGLPVTDWDIATDARPERILHVFPRSSYENRFGTVLARGMEITTFRRDHRYADHRRPDSVTFSSDIYEDLARRDLTINAIAWGRRGPETAPRLVDPADGQGDLEARLVRAVGDPGRRFDEDALRLLRAVRIAARLDFTIEPVTRAAIVAHAGDLAWVSEERVGHEIRRMVVTQPPSRALSLLRETTVLDITLPELAALTEPQLDSTGTTLDAAAAAAPGNERLALSSLLVEIEPAAARAILARLRVGGRESEAVVQLVAAAAVPYEADWTDADVRRYMRRLAADLLDDLLVLRAARADAADLRAESADRGAAAKTEASRREAELRSRIVEQRSATSPLTLADLAVDGRDLRETLGLPEGPLIGRLLDQLLEDVIEEPALNTRTTLLTRASLALDETARRSPGRSRP
jgi:tRNA nucleotidyltransferase/poly(A) polymerase